VASNPAIDCQTPQYVQYGIIVYLTLVLFVIGAPVYLGYFLWKNHKKGMLTDNEFRHRFGILYHRFHPSVYWWTVWTLVRRTLLVALAAFIAERGTRFAIISYFQVFFHLAQTWYEPYLMENENWMASLSLGFLVLLTISLGCFEFPYTNAVQALVSTLVLVPGTAFVIYMIYDKVRQMFWPTPEQQAEIKGLLVFVESVGGECECACCCFLDRA